MEYSSASGHSLIEEPQQQFGGNWTTEKLEAVIQYLKAYLSVLKKQQHLKKIYVDAFAGTGWVEKRESTPISGVRGEVLFPEMVSETADRIQGSTARALTIDPGFDRYVFIESNDRKVRDLQLLASRFPDKTVKIVKGDANFELQELARNNNWRNHRALVFLDPFGMQVRWTTLEALASTRAIDVWYLFPLGVGVNRLLQNDGEIPGYNRNKLDEIFGTTEWRDRFYRTSRQVSLFDSPPSLDKQADFDSIEAFFVERLGSIFPHVSKKPRRLYNSTGNPLYSLCFAAANPGKGGEIAVRIANHLLTKLKRS